MEFVKAHGAGNDFVLLPDPGNRLVLTPRLVRALCAPHVGLGADGVIRIAPARDGVDAEAFMDYWNADGSVAEMCGNGVRCVAKYVLDRGTGIGDLVRVDTRSGVKVVTATLGPDGRVNRVRVDMGAPVPGKIAEPLEIDGRTIDVTTVSMGNPHAVIVVDDVGTAPVSTLGPAVARLPLFPDGTNVEFISAVSPSRIAGRIWERGVGETLASGTGGAAMAVAAHLLGHAGCRVHVDLPGGTLEVDWTEDTLHVTGPAVEVAAGELDDGWLDDIS